MTGTPFADSSVGEFERETERNQDQDTQYAPLSSVWEGSDGELLERMLEFYASIPPRAHT